MKEQDDEMRVVSPRSDILSLLNFQGDFGE